jgi:hypothetical protein
VNAILYLDTLDIVKFDDRETFKKACAAARHIPRPYMSLTHRDRSGRMVWSAMEVHYFDPTKTQQLCPSRS